MSEANPSNMRSLDRAIDVIELLENSEVRLRLTDIAKRCNLHIATAQRILNALERRGRVDVDNSGYAIGLAAVVGAHSYALNSRIILEARPFMLALALSTGLPTSLHLRLDFSRVIVDRVGGDEPARYGGSIGRRLPIHLGAGKVMAALLPEQELTALLETIGEYTLADGTSMDAQKLKEELTEAKAQGYAIAAQERIPGRFSVGAAVQTGDGKWDAAIVLSGRSKSDKFEVAEQMALDVREAAAELSAQFMRNS